MNMKKYAVVEFKSKCLEILDAVADDFETVQITRHGELMATLMPPDHTMAALRNDLKDSVIFEDNVLAPIDEPWAADR